MKLTQRCCFPCTGVRSRIDSTRSALADGPCFFRRQESVPRRLLLLPFVPLGGSLSSIASSTLRCEGEVPFSLLARSIAGAAAGLLPSLEPSHTYRQPSSHSSPKGRGTVLGGSYSLASPQTSGSYNTKGISQTLLGYPLSVILS